MQAAAAQIRFQAMNGFKMSAAFAEPIGKARNG
jgi:hypothetical protein